MVTGPAKLAWITMLVAGCCALSITVHAAGPRDAVKTLPRVTHTSDFRINESDNPNSQTYQDEYYDTWDINWQPRPISLPVGQISIQLQYIKILTDKLDRIDSSSSDSRTDKYNFLVKLEKANYIKSHYALKETDTYSGKYPSDTDAAFRIQTIKEALISWNPPKLPSVTAGHTVTTTAGYTGTSRTDSSEVEQTQIKLNYTNDLGLASQNVQYTSELTRSYTFYPNRTGNNVSKQVWDADRAMPLGNIGNLTLGAHLEEHHSRGDTDPTDSQTNVAQYNVGIGGKVASFPLRYNVGYLATRKDIKDSNGFEDRAQRTISLTFNPPVPEGKKAGLSYANIYNEFENAYNQKGVQNQKLTWSFSPNNRVSSEIDYEQTSTIDRLAQENTQEDEKITGRLSYNIPGNRGSFSSAFTQGIQRIPNEDARNTNNSVNLTTNFRLSDKAKMTLFYSQSNSDNYSGYLDVPATSDKLVSGVSYQISPANGMSLNAKWQQQYQLNLPSEKRTAIQRIELSYSWQTQANWTYALTVKTNDTSTRPGDSSGTTYKTGDEIRALITYSF